MTHAKRAAADKRALDRAASIRAEYPTPVELDVTERPSIRQILIDRFAHLCGGDFLDNVADCIEEAAAIAALATTAGSGQGDVETARRICAQARPDYAAGFLSGEYDQSSTEMRAVLIALAAPQGTGSNREAELEAEVARLRQGVRNIQIEAERESGRWNHLKRVIAINARALLATKEK